MAPKLRTRTDEYGAHAAEFDQTKDLSIGFFKRPWIESPEAGGLDAVKINFGIRILFIETRRLCTAIELNYALVVQQTVLLCKN